MNTCLPGITSNRYESSGSPTSTSTSSSSAISRARQIGGVSPSSILPPGNSHSSRSLSISTTRPSGDCRTPLIETGNIGFPLQQMHHIGSWLIQRHHGDSDFRVMAPTAKYHSAQRRDIGKVPAPGQRDVFQRRLHVVGWIEIHSAEYRTNHRDPSVGCIGANHPWLPRWWLGQQITTDVARRQTTGTNTRQHQVSEVLTEAAPAFQHFHQRRRHLGGLGIEGEFAENLLHQCLDAQQQRPTRWKTAFRELDEVALQMHVR